MAEEESTRRLASRLADLRQLGDRNRANHPVSMLRNDITAKALVPEPEASPPNERQKVPEPTVEERAEVIARRFLSPVLARAEQLADLIRKHGRSVSKDNSH